MDLSAFRDEFPVSERFVYLNHAATGPLPRRTAAAIARQAEQTMRAGGAGFSDWLQAYRELRESAARLLHADPGEIALTKNTSEGLSFIANGLDWRPGDIAVGVGEDFPANYFPWARLERRGVQLRWLGLHQGCLDLEEIDRACAGARLLAVSFVHYLSGFRLDLEAVGEICRRRGCLFVVDAVQGLGPFSADVRAAGIHALSASGHKWLLGPEGAALFYISRELQEQVEPVEFGWTNVEGSASYSREEAVRRDASRYECGTLNTVGCYGLRASLSLFHELEPEARARRVLALTDRLLDKAREKGYQPMAPRDETNGSGIVSLRRRDVDSAVAVRRLAEATIIVSARHGWIRVSPHFYNTEAEIDRLVAALP